MHSTGFTFASLPTLTSGGQVATLEGRSFDARELLVTIGAVRAQVVAIVGDAFALPLQAVARAATATPSTDALSRAVLFACFITDSNPQESGRGRNGDWSAQRLRSGSADVAGVTQTMSGR